MLVKIINIIFWPYLKNYSTNRNHIWFWAIFLDNYLAHSSVKNLDSPVKPFFIALPIVVPKVHPTPVVSHHPPCLFLLLLPLLPFVPIFKILPLFYTHIQIYIHHLFYLLWFDPLFCTLPQFNLHHLIHLHLLSHLLSSMYSIWFKFTYFFVCFVYLVK